MRLFNLGCLLVMFGPFLLGGLVSLLLVWLNWESLDLVGRIVGPIVGCLFTAVGGVPLFAAQLKKSWIARKLVLEKEHPRQPWMWREDWRKGEIRDVGSSGVIWHWAGAVTVAIAMGVLAYQGDQAPAFVYLAEVYPLLAKLVAALTLVIPAFAIGRAIHATLRARKFAGSKFLMSTVPCCLGSKLRGRVETTMNEIPKDGVSVTLRCARVSRASSSSRRRRAESVWSAKQKIEGWGLGRGVNGVTVPVQFDIPSDGEPTGRVRMNVRFEWHLVVTAEVPGVDYRADFVPPVFRLNTEGRIDDDHPSTNV